MNYEKLLEGKKALITAGADGIGYAIARRFEKAGALSCSLIFYSR